MAGGDRNLGQYKQGLDYFPFTIGLLKDRKLRRPKLKFGCVVNDIYLSLLELIYGDKGYYLEYSDRTKGDVIWEILENLQGKYCPTAETVEQVIGDLVACGLFSGDHFKSEILTSKRIQQTYYSATVERKAVDVDFDIWILSEEEMRKLSSNSLILTKFLNRSNEEVNRSNEEVNRSNERESKEKKSSISIDIPQVSKKESIYKNQSSSSRESYDEIMDRWEVGDVLRAALGAFLQHCFVNGQKLTNRRFEDIIDRLYDYYGAINEKGMSDSLYRAIQGGYYDIKELKR